MTLKQQLKVKEAEIAILTVQIAESEADLIAKRDFRTTLGADAGQEVVGEAEFNIQLAQTRVENLGRSLQGAQVEKEMIEGRIRVDLAAPGRELVPHNARLGINLAAGRPQGAVHLMAVDEITQADVAALADVVNNCYLATGRQGPAPDEYIASFFQQVFAGDWTSQRDAGQKPTKPAERVMKDFAVICGTLKNDCDPTKEQPIPPRRRKAGANVFCRVQSADILKLGWMYTDSRGALIKTSQEDENGNLQININFNKAFELIQADAYARFDIAERTRFQKFNEAGYIWQARMSLNWWYHKGIPYARVPDVDFSPQFAPDFSKHGLIVQQAFGAAVIAMLPPGDEPGLLPLWA